MYKLIRLDENTISKIGEMKYQTHSKNFDEVVKMLIKAYWERSQ